MTSLSDYYFELAQKAPNEPIPPAPNKTESAGSPRVIDAYLYPRKVRAGCQHQLGCGCDPPYWLRPSSPEEEAREAKIYPEGTK
jgi:hypothetical protein